MRGRFYDTYYTDITEAVRDVWLAVCRYHDRQEMQAALFYIRQELEPITASAGVVWDDRTDSVLLDAVINFSSSWRVPFGVFFVRWFSRHYELPYRQEAELMRRVKKQQKSG